MPKHAGSRQQPKSELHRKLGEQLQQIRQRAGKNTRQLGGFSSTHVSRVENGLADCSEDFLAEYVKLGGDRIRLLSMLEDIRRASADHRRRQRTKWDEPQDVIDPGHLTPDDTDFHELRRWYRVEEIDDHYLIDEAKVVRRATHIVRVRPLHPAARYYVCSYGSGESSRPGVLTLQTGQGCTLASSTETDRGVLHFVLDFNPVRTSTEDRLLEFTFSISFHEDDPMIRMPMLRNSTRSGIRRIVKRVQFTEPAVPRRIWWFRAVELLETQDSPGPESLLPLNESGFYHHEFNDLVDEYVGLAWDWQEQG